MTTEVITLDEFKKSISNISNKWIEKKYIILLWWKPIFEVTPVNDDWDEYTKEDKEAYKKAKEEYKNWDYYLFDNLEGKIVKNVQNNN